MKTANHEILSSSINKRTLDTILKEREKRLGKLQSEKSGRTVNADSTAVKEGKGKTVIKGILKAVSVTAAVAMIAVFAYLCYLPIYMQEHGLMPAAGNEATNNGIETAAVTADEVTVEVTEPGRDEPYDYGFRCREELTDATAIKIGMTCEEVEAALPKNTYSVGLFSKRGIKYYVNDKETGHVFFVYCKDGRVTDVRDSGTDADHAAPESSLEKLHDGMSFDEVVDILGSPILSFLPEGRLSVTFKVKDRVTAFYFTQKYDNEYGVTDNVLCNCEQTVYRYGKNELLCGYCDLYRADTVSEEDAGKVSAGMTFGEVYEIIGSPIRHEEFGADEVAPCWRLGMNTWLRIRFVPATYTVTDPLTEFVAEAIDTEVLNHSIGYPDPGDRDFKAAERFDKNDLKTWFDPYREAELDTEAVNKIAPDMTFEELVDLLGRPQRGASPAEPGIKCNMQWEYSGGYTLIVTFDTNGNCVPVCDMTVVRCQLYDWNIVESSPNTNPVIIDIHK